MAVTGYMDLSDISSALRIFSENRIYHQFSNHAPLMYAILPSVTNTGFKGLRWQGTLHTNRNLSFGGQPEGSSYFFGDYPHERYAEAYWDVVSTYIHLRLTAQMIARAGRQGEWQADDMVVQQFNGAAESLLRLEHFELVRGDGTGRLAKILADNNDANANYQVDDYRLLEAGQKVMLSIQDGTALGGAVVATAWTVVSVSTTFIPYAGVTDEGGYLVVLTDGPDTDGTPGEEINVSDTDVFMTTPLGYGEQLFGLNTLIGTANPPQVGGADNFLGNRTRIATPDWQCQTEDFTNGPMNLPQLKALRDRCVQVGGSQPNYGYLCQELWNAIGFGQLASQFSMRRERLSVNFEALNFFGTRLIAEDLIDLPGGNWAESVSAARTGSVRFMNTAHLAYAWAPAYEMGTPIRLRAREVAPGTDRTTRVIDKVMFHWVAYAGLRGGRLVLSQVGHWALGQMFGWRQLCAWRMNGGGWAQNILR